MTDRHDLVIVGGGVGGAALATATARAGLSVLVLEKSTVYRDHVRGEWMAPWGVIELTELGLYDVVRAAGGHHLSRHQALDEEVSVEIAALETIDMTTLVPGVPGPLCLGHPALCQLLIEQAAQAGAVVRRGVDDVQVTLSARPTVAYRHDGAPHDAVARLVVGADGRGSVVRRQAGIVVERDRTHHLFGGMLVDGADGWPDDLQVIGSARDVHFLVFPQGHGRARLYLGYGIDQAKRFSGASGPQAFLDAFRLEGVPDSEHLPARARPAPATPTPTRTRGPTASHGRDSCSSAMPPDRTIRSSARGCRSPSATSGSFATRCSIRATGRPPSSSRTLPSAPSGCGDCASWRRSSRSSRTSSVRRRASGAVACTSVAWRIRPSYYR